MSDTVIYPRSARETMDGWVHLPRFIDKVRLHVAGRLPSDYHENLTKGFDGLWLQAAGVNADQFIELVRTSITDGEIYDWVRTNVKKSAEEKATYNQYVLSRGRDNEEMKARLKWRLEGAGLSHRTDIETFVDFIDADEKRI